MEARNDRYNRLVTLLTENYQTTSIVQVYENLSNALTVIQAGHSLEKAYDYRYIRYRMLDMISIIHRPDKNVNRVWLNRMTKTIKSLITNINNGNTPSLSMSQIYLIECRYPMDRKNIYEM